MLWLMALFLVQMLLSLIKINYYLDKARGLVVQNSELIHL